MRRGATKEGCNGGVYRRNGRLETADISRPRHEDDVAKRTIATGRHRVQDTAIPKLKRMHITSSRHDKPPSSGRWARNVLAFCLLVSLPSVILWIKHTDESIVHFECPRAVAMSMNYIPSENGEYEHATNQIKENMTEFMQSFRNSTFDEWGRTYERVKEGM